MTQKLPPNLMDFTELLREWLELDNRPLTREESERHWHLMDEINRRAPAEES